MKADLRISIKDYHRNKNLKILLLRAPFAPRQFLVRMNSMFALKSWAEARTWQGWPSSCRKAGRGDGVCQRGTMI
jgi:hypothetical protein